MIKHFLYYIPGLRNGDNVSKAILDTVGNSVTDCFYPVTNVDNGPFQQGSGILFAAIPKHITPEAAEIERTLWYNADPAKQVWFQGAGFSVGYNVDEKPNADDLVRKIMVGGYHYECPTTGNWMVPLARKADGDTYFDPVISFDPEGKMVKKTPARYASICKFAEEHWELITGIESTNVGIDITADQKHCDVAVEALGINYHVGKYELALLEAVTLSGAVHICSYLADWPGYSEIMLAKMDAEKKSNPPEDS